MKIYIVDSKNERKPMIVMESELVSELKKQIQREYNMNDEVELLYNGIILNDNEYLSDLDITEGVTINYLGIFKAG
jgi:hypothetical protein